MSITEIAIKRPTLVVVIFTVLGIFGISSYTRLKYDLIPKMNIPVVSVITMYPGASAAEVESSVTKKIEDALSSLENVKNMQSTSQEGASSITLELESNANTDLALQDAQRKVNAILSTLPVNAKTPALSKFSSDELPVMKLGVTANMQPTKLYQLVDDQIKSQLSKINGVGQVTLIGGYKREVKININKKKLDSYKLSIASIFQSLNNANLELPTGKITGDLKEYTVRLSGKLKSLDDLRNLIITKTITGSVVKLSDIAEVFDGTAELSNLNRINGLSSIGMVIQKQSDANTVEVCKIAKAQVKSLEKAYASYNLKFDIASDTSLFTLESANGVMEDLILAIFLVAIVMFLFLHSVRNSFIVLISIPSSIISVFAAMYVFNFSLNLMTLMALSLIIGILVDDSIVVLENIHRHLEMGKERRSAALDGRNEIGFTAVAITMVDVVVFVPLAMVIGMIGNMLREFSLVIVFSTAMSLFVSFTVTPLLASRFSKIEKLNKGRLLGRLAIGFESIFKQVTLYYDSILRWCLDHRRTVYGIVLLLLAFSFSLVGFGFIGVEFIAQGDRGEFTIKLEGEPQNTLYQTNMLTEKVEDLLFKKPEVKKVFSNVGYSSGARGSGSDVQNKSEITVTILPKEQRKQSIQEYAASVKEEIQQIPGLKVTATPVSMMGNADDAPIQVLLRGPELSKLFIVADSVMKIMKALPGTDDIKLSIDQSKPEMQIKLNREKMALLGLSVFDVANTLRLSFAGNTDLQFSELGKDYNMNVKFDQFDRRKIDDIGSLTFLNNQGKIIELRSFAEIFQSLGPNKLQRYDRISSLTVSSSVFGRPIGTVGAELKEKVSKNLHPDNITIEYKGQLERQSEAFNSLFTVILAAIVFVYLVMVALYNSYLHPFVVLFSIPVAVIGALLALAISGNYLNIFSIIGMIMLIGLVAKNAILLVDFTNQLRAKGIDTRDALLEAGKERLRPILMTTFSMIFGMLPIALSNGASSESKNGLAWVIIGGLSSSLLLTLVLVPSVYSSMESYKVKIKNKFRKKEKNADALIAEI
jgi:hydrophobic/amphiphilic exporter-1 (mainly G- bacteria), HAE1 family